MRQHTALSRCVIAMAPAALLIASHAGAQLPAGTWQSQWGDDFSGATLDQTKWSYHYPWGTTHNHDAVMDRSQVVVSDGSLKLIAERTGPGR